MGNAATNWHCVVAKKPREEEGWSADVCVLKSDPLNRHDAAKKSQTRRWRNQTSKEQTGRTNLHITLDLRKIHATALTTHRPNCGFKSLDHCCCSHPCWHFKTAGPLTTQESLVSQGVVCPNSMEQYLSRWLGCVKSSQEPKTLSLRDHHSRVWDNRSNDSGTRNTRTHGDTKTTHREDYTLLMPQRRCHGVDGGKERRVWVKRRCVPGRETEGR